MATRRIQIPVLTVEEVSRFWGRVGVSGLNECWLWSGARSRTNKYGRFTIRRNKVCLQFGPHCIAWTLTNGPIPLGLLLRHSCDSEACCNPSHLVLGKDIDNKGDSIRRFRNKRLLSDVQVQMIRAAFPARTQSDIAGEFGIDQSTVSTIVNHRIYKYVEDLK